MSKINTGKLGEELACKFLKEKGYLILERNYKIRGGELDIIARDKEDLVFVEVKTRNSHEFGTPVESMTFWKIKLLLKTAVFYILKINWGNKPYRLDFISVDFTNKNTDKNTNSKNPQIEHIENITS